MSFQFRYTSPVTNPENVTELLVASLSAGKPVTIAKNDDVGCPRSNSGHPFLLSPRTGRPPQTKGRTKVGRTLWTDKYLTNAHLIIFVCPF